MILALLAAPLKVTAAEQNGESSDKQQNETTEQKTEENAQIEEYASVLRRQHRR